MDETNEANMKDHTELVKINQKIRKEQGFSAILKKGFLSGLVKAK